MECLYAVTRHITVKQMECRHLIGDPQYQKDWDQSCVNELGRLSQGLVNKIKDTNTLFFILSYYPLQRKYRQRPKTGRLLRAPKSHIFVS
mmetsp:Transcript_19624/g.40220  ORF Transcript_19624/g.40220 Transcript_19624/m.40220 type:complete len:90 (+) Transcript_19624:1238-1507(+)